MPTAGRSCRAAGIGWFSSLSSPPSLLEGRRRLAWLSAAEPKCWDRAGGNVPRTACQPVCGLGAAARTREGVGKWVRGHSKAWGSLASRGHAALRGGQQALVKSSRKETAACVQRTLGKSGLG